MKQGCLVYDRERDSYDVRFGLEEYRGGLFCGECLEVLVKNKWVPTRIEKWAEWYLVDVIAGDLTGLRVRLD